MAESSSGERLAAVRAYASEVMGCPTEAITAVARFEDGNRHGVYQVSYRGASDAAGDVVVRVSYSNEAFDLAQATREAAVLGIVGGVAAPELYDFRRTSGWFDTPAMRTIRLTLAWARDPLPRTLQDQLYRAADALAESFAAARGRDSFACDEGLALLHGDIATGNVLWDSGPCLIDWEYTRLGDPADEIAYTLDQNALTPSQRQAFWDGYRRGAVGGSRLDRIVERADWWEPVTLLGSTLWWVERWVRRAEAVAEGRSDPEVPREPDYYLGHVTSRVDRLVTLVSPL